MSPSLLNAASLTLVCAVIASLAAPTLHDDAARQAETPAPGVERLADLYMELVTPDGASAPRQLPPVELVRRIARADGQASEIVAATAQDALTVRR